MGFISLCKCVTSVVSQQDNLAFPLICPDWNADEEMLLLEVFSFIFGITSGFELLLWRSLKLYLIYYFL